MAVNRRPSVLSGIGLDAIQELENGSFERIRREWARLSDKRRTWTPFLVLPYKSVNPTLPGQTPDLGRVRPVPAGDAFWASPYIVVENSGGIGLTARAGEENFVHARVFNFGKASSAPTQVDFHWADPSLGLGPDTFHHIGTEWVEVRHGSSLNVRCRTPWIPVLLNEGHECLMVNTSCPMVSAVPGNVFGPFDPIQVPFAPWLDRHVGQRNLTVVPAPGGAMKLSLTLTNVLPFVTVMLVTLTTGIFEIDAAYLAEFGEPEVLTGLAALVDDPPREGPVRAVGRLPAVEVAVGEVVGRIYTDASRAFTARLIEYVGKTGGRSAGEVVARIEMKQGEQRIVEVVVEGNRVEAGQFAVVTLGQRWEDLPLGGYTLIGAVE